MVKKRKTVVIEYMNQPSAPLMQNVSGIPWVNAASWVTSVPTQIPWQVVGNLTVYGSFSATGGISWANLSWTNTGDETTTTIKNKLWQATTSTDWWLSSTDWNIFNNKAPKWLTGTKVYYVADTSWWANTRKLTFQDWVLISES